MDSKKVSYEIFEFFSNGTVKKSTSKGERFINYKIDSLLHVGEHVDEIRYYYVFYENKMRLTYESLIVCFGGYDLVYQRKK